MAESGHVINVANLNKCIGFANDWGGSKYQPSNPTAKHIRPSAKHIRPTAEHLRPTASGINKKPVQMNGLLFALGPGDEGRYSVTFTIPDLLPISLPVSSVSLASTL